jgi:hypothetical protein
MNITQVTKIVGQIRIRFLATGDCQGMYVYISGICRIYNYAVLSRVQSSTGVCGMLKGGGGWFLLFLAVV